VNLGSLQGAPQQLRALPRPVLHALLEAFARSYQVVYRWAIPFAVATLLLALLLREAPLRTTAHVGRDQESAARPLKTLNGAGSLPAGPVPGDSG